MACCLRPGRLAREKERAMKVRELMSSEVETCQPGTTLTDAAMAMWRRDCGIVPVVEGVNNEIAGVITDRDICIATATRHDAPERITVGEVMQRDVVTCRPEQDVQDALETMREYRVRRLPAVDANNRLVGILSVSDVLRHAEPVGARGHAGVPSEDVLTAFKAICMPRAGTGPELTAHAYSR
jgi:CBS domain-containing protein